MTNNYGFLAVGVLAIALLFLASRDFDAEGRFDPLRHGPPARIETGAGGEARIVLEAGPGGHFFFEGEADGAAVRFMVDTGASVVTLTESDARAAGLRFGRGDFRVPFETANGTVYAAPARLSTLRIGSAVIEDLDVAVVRDKSLGGSLFGVNGLNRFTRRETTADELVLISE